jgi:uncharacterized protein DUF4349
MKRTQLTVGAVALVGVVALAACTSSGSSKSGAGAAGAMSVKGQSGGGAAAARPGMAPEPARAKQTPIAKTLVTQALIRTADLTVEMPHGHSLTTPADQAEEIALAAGGQVFADERSGGRSPIATITLKVPGEALGGVVDKLAALGKEKARRTSTQDVTGQVADVDSRVRSARASIAQLRVLFDRAVKVGDLIALENELSQREADLEALEAQQRALEAQTAMATLTLHLTTAGAAPVAHHKHHATGGFVGGLRNGWQAFQSAAGAVATGVGAVLPFLLLALVVGAAAVALRRRFRSAAPPGLPPADPA